MSAMAWGFAEKGLYLSDDVLALLCERGFSHVELRVMEVDHEGALFNPQVARRLRETLRQHEIGLSLHCFSGVNLGEKVPRIRQTCMGIVEDQLLFGEQAGAQWLTVHLGSAGFAYDCDQKRKRLDLALEAVGQLLERTAGAKIAMGLENLHRLPFERQKTYLGDRLGEFNYLLSSLPEDRVGVVFDVGHAHLNPECAPLEFLESVAHRLLALHVHQNNGIQDQHHPLTDQWPQANPELTKAILTLGGKGIPLILEHHAHDDIFTSQDVLRAAHA